MEYFNYIYNYFKPIDDDKIDIFVGINFEKTELYNLVTILNNRKQEIYKYRLQENFELNKISILKYKLSILLKSNFDKTDEMIKYIQEYKPKIISKKVDEDIQYNSLYNRLNKLNEEEDEDDDDEDDDNEDENNNALTVKKMKICN